MRALMDGDTHATLRRVAGCHCVARSPNVHELAIPLREYPAGRALARFTIDTCDYSSVNLAEVIPVASGERVAPGFRTRAALEHGMLIIARILTRTKLSVVINRYIPRYAVLTTTCTSINLAFRSPIDDLVQDPTQPNRVAS